MSAEEMTYLLFPAVDGRFGSPCVPDSPWPPVFPWTWPPPPLAFATGGLAVLGGCTGGNRQTGGFRPLPSAAEMGTARWMQERPAAQPDWRWRRRAQEFVHAL